MASTKSIIANLNQGDKLNKMLKTITQPMVEPEHGNTNIGAIWKHIKLISAKIVWLGYCCWAT